MQFKIVTIRAKRRHARVFPHVRAIAAETAEFDVIAVGLRVSLEDSDQFVLAPIKRSQAGVVFDPHAEVDLRQAYLCGRYDEVGMMPPVYADVNQRTVASAGFEYTERPCKE